MKKQTTSMAARLSGFLRVSCVTALLLTLGACGSSGGGGSSTPNGDGTGNSGSGSGSGGNGGSGGSGSGGGGPVVGSGSDSGSGPSSASVIKFFDANDGINGPALWKTDGTPDGTVLVKDINATSASAGPGVFLGSGFTAFNGAFYFKANDGVHGSELWKTDGTADGTVLVKDINPANEPLFDPMTGATFGPSDFTVFNGQLYFNADDGVNGKALWKTDGTPAGTMLIKAIKTGGPFVKLNDALYFTANDGVHGNELWKTDGTEVGTALVKDINTMAGGHSNPNGFFEFNGAYYFQANDGVHGIELWKTDGTTDGTVLVKDINSTSGAGSLPNNFTKYNDTLYFVANDGVHGSEIWKTDGTDIGTVLLKDINATTAPSNLPPYDATSPPTDFKVFNNALYFQADDGVHGYELWKTDGTPEGTKMIKDINAATTGGAAPTIHGGFTEFKGALYFSAANDDVHGEELWKTDGTAEGTVMVKDINVQGTGSGPSQLTVFNDTLYFIADDGVHGNEIWKTDGTEAGTKLVKDTNPSGSYSPGPFFVLNSKLFFYTNDAVHRLGLWTTDGTEEGTVLVKNFSS